MVLAATTTTSEFIGLYVQVLFASIGPHRHIFPIFFFFLQFTEALNTGRKIFPAYNLTGADRDFLQSIYISASPGEASVAFSKYDDEKLQGYAIVLKIIAGENFF